MTNQGRKPAATGRGRREARERLDAEIETPHSAYSARESKLVGPILGAAGVVITIVGFVMIARGDITAAPILLVLAYLVLFPLALTR